MKSSVLLACSVTLALSPSATAQNTPTWTHSHTAYWDSTTVGTGGPIGRLVAGEVTGGAQLDVLALGGSGGTQLLLLDAVESNTAMLLYGSAVRDFDLKPKDATTGRQDVVYVDTTGLWSTSWVDGTGFASPTFVTTPSGQPWALAKKVRCGFADATAGLDYVGLSQNMRRVLYFGGTEWSTLDTGPRVYEMLLADYYGDAKLEIVLLTHDGVSVLDATTSISIVDYPHAYVAGDAITTFRTGSGTKSGVAWLRQVSGGGAPSLTAMSYGATVPASLDLADAVALRAGDADADGRDDLIFARANALAPSWLCNTGSAGSPNYSTGTRSIAVANPGYSPPTGPGVAPLLTDLNNDDLADVFAPVCGTSAAALVLMLADFTPAPPGDPPPGGHIYIHRPASVSIIDPITGFFPRCGGVLDSNGGVIYDSGSKLKWSAYYDVVPSAATHLEVKLWKRQVVGETNTDYTEPACQLVRYLPLPTGASSTNTFRAVQDIPTSQLSSPACSQRALWIEMRLVQINGVIGNPVSIYKGWPVYTVALFAHCDAVAGMIPTEPEEDINFAMPLELDLCTLYTTCTDGWDSLSCTESSPPVGSTPPPMVTLRNKRPLPPGTVPTYPSPTGAGSVIANDAQ